MQEVTPQSQQPADQAQAGQDPTSGMSNDERSSYWRNVAVENRTAAQQFKQYEVLIDHLNQNPQHVDDFERIITGQATLIATAEDMANGYGNDSRRMSEEDKLAEELGFPPEGQGRKAIPSKQGRPQAVAPDVDEAKRLGAAEERARIELAQFKQDLLQNGVGEHLIDEFEQFLRRPDGLAFYDMFAAWRSNKARKTGTDPLTGEKLDGSPPPKGEGQGSGMPSSVSTMPAGVSNRPGSGANQQQAGSGDKYVHSPANI
jgi:DNA primase